LRNVNHLWLCRFDANVIRFDTDNLFGITLQNPVLLGLPAQALNRCFDITFLCDICLPERCSPVLVLRHHLKDLRIMRERLNADIPGLRLDETFIYPAIQQ
jgi:hypothetical protein